MAMELPTYSAVFAFEKRLYAVYDFELPISVSLFQGGVFLAALGATIAATALLGIAMSAGTFWIFVLPPGFAAYLAARPLGDGKRPHQWIATHARHLGEPRALARLHPQPGGPARWRPRSTAYVGTGPAVAAEFSTSAIQEECAQP
jgi:hypothetical protein